MTTKERLRLSAWQKWKLYGRFPWKLTLHLLLLLLTTLRLLSWNVSNDEYFRATSRTFTYFFLPEDYEFPADRAYTIYTFESATKAIERVVKNYEEINSFSVDTYQHFLLDKPDPSGIAIHNIMPVTLTFQQLGNLTDDISKQHDGTAKINGKLQKNSPSRNINTTEPEMMTLQMAQKRKSKQLLSTNALNSLKQKKNYWNPKNFSRKFGH